MLACGDCGTEVRFRIEKIREYPEDDAIIDAELGCSCESIRVSMNEWNLSLEKIPDGWIEDG